MKVTRLPGIPPAPGVTEGRWSTPAEWVDWFLSLSREHQEAVAETRIEDAQDAMRCHLEDHAGRLTEPAERVQGEAGEVAE